MFDRFTERARKVMVLARQEAHRLRNDYIGTEHLLLGLLQVDEGVAAHVLRGLGLNLQTVRAETMRLVEEGTSPVSEGQLPFTPRVKRVLERALEEAVSLGHDYIGTEHLFLGLLHERDGPAAHVLSSLGVQPAAARAETVRLLGTTPQVSSPRASDTALERGAETPDTKALEERLRERVRAVDPPCFRDDCADLAVMPVARVEDHGFVLWFGHEPDGRSLRTELTVFASRTEILEERFDETLALFLKLVESESKNDGDSITK